MPALPQEFCERLAAIVPPAHVEKILQTFDAKDIVVVRINTLKISVDEAGERLRGQGVRARSVDGMSEAMIIENPGDVRLSELPEIQQGLFYRQSVSSMLPPLVLAVQPGERVLDLCAAPGSKTTQMAAMMNNEGTIVAVEAVRGRYYKLKSVCSLLGAGNVNFKCLDGRRFRSPELFDRILVDAPCSSEGRFRTADPETFRYWSPRKIKEMVRKQRGLLLSASRLLKPGGVMVYSTCTFAPEENEGVVDWLLRKSAGAVRLEEVSLEGIKTYPALTAWNNKTFDPQVRRCLRVLPGQITEGFFIAKLTRVQQEGLF